MDKNKIADFVDSLTDQERDHLMGALAYSAALLNGGSKMFSWTSVRGEKKQVCIIIL